MKPVTQIYALVLEELKYLKNEEKVLKERCVH